MKAIEQYFPVVLFIMLHKVVLAFESVDEILKCDHSVIIIELKTFEQHTNCDVHYYKFYEVVQSLASLSNLFFKRETDKTCLIYVILLLFFSFSSTVRRLSWYMPLLGPSYFLHSSCLILIC